MEKCTKNTPQPQSQHKTLSFCICSISAVLIFELECSNSNINWLSTFFKNAALMQVKSNHISNNK